MNKDKVHIPPKLPLRFLQWFCDEDYLEEIEGDLTEVFIKESANSARLARWMFAWRVLKYVRPEFIKSFKNQSYNPMGMYKNYFKISLRQLVKNKAFAFINIAGLTLGITCFLILALYLHDELSFDTFHHDADRIVRVMQHDTQDDGSIRNIAQVSALLGKESAMQFEEIEATCKLTAFGRRTLGNDPALRNYERIWSPDENYFQFFNFPLLEGDAVTALKAPDAIVLTETLSKKYFGNEPALGKTIWSGYMREGKPVYFTVTGVMKDLPNNSHLQIPILFTEATWPTIFKGYNESVSNDWESSEYVTYFKLKPGTDLQALAAKITNLVRQNYPKDKEFKSTFSLMPLKDIHFYQDNAQDNELNANSIKPFYLYMFAAIGLLLLLIACLNYMNLSTAAALKRTHEIGTRKALGAFKGQLIGQFITDSTVISVVSLFISLLLVQLLLPAINNFSGKEMSLIRLPFSWMLITVGIILFSGLVAALYPAFISTSVSAVEAMKREIKLGNNGLPVRKLLLVAQFSISIIMIASTLVIYKQLNYLREKDLGFNHENLLVIDINSSRLRQNFEAVKSEFSKPSEVISITTSTRVPGEWKGFPVPTVRNVGDSKGHDMIYVGIDKDFLKTYNIKLLEGRTIDDPKADSLKIVLTQMAVKQLGLTNPIGQMIEIPDVRFGGSREVLDQPFQVEVIGVVQDFHFESLRKEMMPVIFGAPNTVIQQIDYYTLRIRTSNWDETLQKLKAINTQLDANNPLEYTFLDNRFEELYQADTKRGQLFLTFAIVVVLIACMGLFALVSYTVESRMKEFGVRKVLGASVQSIVGLVSKDFLALVLISGFIALPAAWYFTQQWLEDFAYRAAPGVGLFLLALLVALAISFLTIIIRVFRAASNAPVNSLKSE